MTTLTNLMLTKAQADEWIAKLRSGEYEQSHGRLRRRIGIMSTDPSIGYCCLGVLGEHVLGYEVVTGATDVDSVSGGLRDSSGAVHTSYISDSVLPQDFQTQLAELNDGCVDDAPSASFNEIADYIERSTWYQELA